VAPSPVLITGYSQGSLIAPAVVAQLPPRTIGKVALLTLACPFRRLYGRAFPAYFSYEYAVELNELLMNSSAPEFGRMQATRTGNGEISFGTLIISDPGFLPNPNRLANSCISIL